jgi:Putative metallopeptidase
MISRLPRQSWIPLLLFALALASRPANAQATPAQPAPAQPATPQAKVDAFAQGLAKNPKFKKLSPKYLQAVTEFVIGNTLFAMLHELGHAATNQLKIPVLGRKEDAADIFAATRLIKFNNDFTDGVLDMAAKGWFMTDRRDTKTGDTVPYYDEHGLDQQRAYQIVCLMVGTGDQKYRSLAEDEAPEGPPEKLCERLRRGIGELGCGADAAFARAEPAEDEDRCGLWRRQGRPRRLRPGSALRRIA